MQSRDLCVARAGQGQYSLNIHERRTFHGGLHDGTHVVGKSGAKLKNVGYFAS